MLAMHALHAARACGDADCNWTSPVSAIEWQSGLFFLLGGLVGALSVCRSLERGAPRRSLLVTAAVRGAVIAATGYAARAFDIVFTKRVFAPLAVRAPLRLPSAAHLWRDAVDASSKSLSEPHVLPFHGINSAVCALATVVVLGALPRRRWRNVGVPALLCLAAAVLAAAPALYTLADRATCCKVRRDDCEKTGVAAPTAAPPFRVPRACALVVGNGTAAAGSPFDPCDFSAAGGLYLPPCGDEKEPTAAWPCERAARPARSECVDEGPWPCDEAGCPPEPPGLVSCTQLAALHYCGATFGDIYDASVPATLDGAGRVADHCQLSCRPGECLNAARSAAFDRVAAALGANKSTAAKPEGEAAVEKKGVDVEETDDASGAATREAGCRYRLQRVSGSARQWHGVARTELGRQWCPELVWSPVTHLPETVANTCERVPSYRLPSFASSADLTLGEKAAAVALQLLFGLHGVFGYLATSLVGAAIGVAVHESRGLDRRTLALASAAAVAAFAVGLQLTKQLRRAEAVEGHPQPMPSADAFLRAGVHQRLLFGAIEVGIVLVLLGAVEASPQRRAAWRRANRLLSPIGKYALTVFVLHRPVMRALLVPFLRVAIGAGMTLAGGNVDGDGGALGIDDGLALGAAMSRARASAAEEGLLLGYLGAVAAFWVVALQLWARVGYVGTLEWAMQRLRIRGAATARPDDDGDGDRHVGAAQTAVAAVQIIALYWAPAVAWGVYATRRLAPGIDDYYHRNQAATLLLTAAGRPTVSALLLGATFALPVVAAVLLVAAEGLARMKQ